MAERAENRRRRWKLLMELIQREEISSQNQLQKRLADLGVEVNQATLSRDLRELGVIKVPLGSTGSRYVLPGSQPSSRQQYEETFKRLVLGVERSVNILVLRTGPGHAAAAALAMDHLAIQGVVGTVAGDDTFLAILGEGEDWARIHRELVARIGLAPVSE
jgi:transcriptional regulator of arginine metabolism